MDFALQSGNSEHGGPLFLVFGANLDGDGAMLVDAQSWLPRPTCIIIICLQVRQKLQAMLPGAGVLSPVSLTPSASAHPAWY